MAGFERRGAYEETNVTVTRVMHLPTVPTARLRALDLYVLGLRSTVAGMWFESLFVEEE